MTLRWNPAPSALLAILLAAAGCGRQEQSPSWSAPWSGDAPTFRAEYVVDLTRVQGERIPVTVRITGLEGDFRSLRHKAENDEYKIHDVRFEDAEGRPVPHRADGQLFIPESYEGDLLQASWLVETGKMGRHGLQGIVTSDWGMFEGRIFLFPRGDRELQGARIQYLLPRGWKVATPFRRDGDWFYADTFEPDDVPTVLEGSCVGVGRFDVEERQYGEMAARVAVYSGWSDEHKAKLFESSFRIVDYYHRTLGFDLRAPYLVAWSPKHKGLRVHGGASATGTCLEQPEYQTRPFQLMAHRIAHSMDKYRPSGLHASSSSHYWFREGWPSYMEVIATEAAGVVDDQTFFNKLYATYKVGRSDNIERDIPLTEEKSARGHVVEFLHYKKAPLVTRMLADEIEARSGRTILDFMRQTWAEYGFYRKPFDVKKELEAFTGTSFDDFWQMLVLPRGTVIPVWPEYLTRQIRDRMKHPPAAHVDDEPISGSYLFYLVRSGLFTTYEDVVRFVVTEQARRRQLAEHGVRLYPDELRRHLFALPGEDRQAVAIYEASHPLPPPDESSIEEVKFLPASGNGDGTTFFRLLELERADRTAGSGIVVLTRGDKGEGQPRLGFGADAVLQVVPPWGAQSRRAQIELEMNGEVSKSWTIERDAADSPQALVTAADRPSLPGLVTLRVTLDGGRPIARTFWQRGVEPEASNVRGHGLLSDDIVSAAPDDPEVWYKNGLVLAAKGNHISAVSSLHQAVTLDPTDPTKWFKYGQSLMKLDRFEDAVEAFDRVLALSKGHLAAGGDKALALARMDRREESLRALDALMESSEEPLRHYWRGQVLDRLGELEQATEAYRTYAGLAPRRPDGWRGLGHALLRLERYEEAIEAFDRAIAADPKDGISVRERALAERALAR